MDFNQSSSGSSYRPNMNFSQPSQQCQTYSPLRGVNLEMDLEDYMADYLTQQYLTQNYLSQDVSMGKGSGHGSYHGSMPVEDNDDVEKTSPVKPKKPSRRAT